MPADQQRAFIGLGANLNDPRHTLARAVHELAHLPCTQVVALSSVYRSAPVDAQGPDFLNAVAELRTSLPAGKLLAALHQIEDRHGRSRPFRNAPRTLDLDLLMLDQQIIADENLQLPHPRMHERAFVLVPLAEIAAELQIPGQPALPILLARCAEQPIELIAEAQTLLEHPEPMSEEVRTQ